MWLHREGAPVYPIPAPDTQLFPDSKTAMREALVRLADQVREFPGMKMSRFYSTRAPGRQPRSCAIGIVLGPYAQWAQDHQYRDFRQHLLAPIAPDARDYEKHWRTLMRFHDLVWEPQTRVTPAQQLKDWAAKGEDAYAPELAEFLDL